MTVCISLNQANVQHEKLEFQLVKPFIEGFSIKSGVEEEATAVVAMETDQGQGQGGRGKTRAQKRKQK